MEFPEATGFLDNFPLFPPHPNPLSTAIVTSIVVALSLICAQSEDFSLLVTFWSLFSLLFRDFLVFQGWVHLRDNWKTKSVLRQFLTFGSWMSAPKCLFFPGFWLPWPKFLGRDIRTNGPRMSAGYPSQKLPLWADFSFLTSVSAWIYGNEARVSGYPLELHEIIAGLICCAIEVLGVSRCSPFW